MTFSNLRIIGTRTCERCNQPVNIIERDGQQVSECLNCEHMKLQDEVIAYKQNMDKQKAEIVFRKFSMVPDDLHNADFSNYKPQNESTEMAKRKCEWYANHFRELTDMNSLLLQGLYGLGKSHLAYSIAKRVKAMGQVVIFITMPELLNVLRDSYGNSKFSEAETLKACKDADLLILDDMGAEYIKMEDGESWATDRIFQIVNSRTDKPNIFTTNLNSKELAYKYGSKQGPRIVSRMMNGTRVIKFEGNDYRLKEW